MNFNDWLETFIEEKEIDTEQFIFDGDNKHGEYHLMPLSALIEIIKNCPKNEQDSIKNQIVKIDFANADVIHYFRFLAQHIVDTF